MVRVPVVASGIIAIAVIAVIGGLGAPVLAQPKQPAPPSNYRTLYERGKRLSAAHDWEAAREAFVAAYALEHRPINLYNIATTYWHEHAIEQARDYYQRFLDEAPSDDTLVPLATERLTELRLLLAAPAPSTSTSSPPDDEIAPAPPPRPRDPYPREVLDRPATLLGGMAELVGGVGAMPRFSATMTGSVAATYDPAAIIGLGVGVTRWLELRGDIDADLRHARSGLASVGAAAALSTGVVTAAVAANLRYELDTPGPYDASFGVPLRIRVSKALALISNDDQLVVTLDGDRRRVLVRIPVGVGYQATDAIYAWLGAVIIATDVRTALVDGGVTYAASRAFDVGVMVRASDVGGYGNVVARWRL